MKIYFISLLCLINFGCVSNPYEKGAWRVVRHSEKNNQELIFFLNHYKELGDKEKYAAACFLVSNLPGKYAMLSDHMLVYDVDIVKSDSLIWSLDYSFALREQSSFLKSYSQEQFLEYILPHRVANEPLEYGWKWDLKKYLNVSSKDIRAAAEEINSQIKLDISPKSYGDLPQSYSSLIKNGYGKCDDRTMLVVMALRAMGIPAAYEFVPYWGSSNNGHSFVSVILPDGMVYPLQNTNKVTMDGYVSRKTPKIYRRMYARQENNSFSDSIPELFRYGDLKDVTHLHQIGYSDVSLSEKKITSDGLDYYLSVFSPNGWIPIAASQDIFFQDIGTGTRFNENEIPEAEDLGEGILYLPSLWKQNEVMPVGNPIIVASQGIREIMCDTSCQVTVKLVRKYPLNYRILNFTKFMLGGIFEGANRKDFSDAETLYIVSVAPVPKMQYVQIHTDKSYRYIRYQRSKGTFSIAEIAAKDAEGKMLSFKPMVCEALEGEVATTLIFDGDPLTYYQMGAGLDLWVGMDFGHPVKIDKLGFAPRNDDNAVTSTDTYELFYWQNAWKSLGVCKPASDTLVYENVPSGALLWLRNLTKGKEERPFTYEDKKQIWW